MKNREPQPKDTPATLYKYRYFDSDGYHLNVLRNSSLYFSSFDKFNDPYDSTLKFDYTDDPPGTRKLGFQKFLREIYPKAPINEIENLVDQRLKKINSSEDYFEEVANFQTLKNKDKYGICSLTPNPRNLLMWAHYSNNHAGFCVGIDAKKLLEEQYSLIIKNMLLGLIKIHYTENYPKINFFHSLNHPNSEAIIDLLVTKSIEWKYEDEYRLLLIDKTNHELKFSQNIFSEIILGCNIKIKDKRNILSIIKINNLNIPVYQSILSQAKFQIDLEEITS
jgi:hypothetical protein